MKKEINAAGAPGAIGPYSQAIEAGGSLKVELLCPMNEVYATYFSKPFPARCAFAVKELPKQALVEIEVIAKL